MKKRSDLQEVERALLWLCKQHGIQVVDLMTQDTDISKLPPEFLDGSVVDIVNDDEFKITLGFHPDPEVRVLALAHETGHILAPAEKGILAETIMERETVAWLWVIRFLKRRFPRLKLGMGSVARCIHMLKSYEDYERYTNKKPHLDRRMPIQMWRQFGRLRSRT